jgi:hypothetical protein
MFETDFSEYATDAAPSDWTARWYTSFHNRLIREGLKVIGGKKFFNIDAGARYNGKRGPACYFMVPGLWLAWLGIWVRC